jgi:hypothetical protein
VVSALPSYKAKMAKETAYSSFWSLVRFFILDVY